MKKIDEIKKNLELHKEELKQRYGIKELGIFGSYVRGEERKDSDLDLLAEFEDGAKLGLLEFIRVENYLTDLLGIKVDLVEKSALKPRIGRLILKEVVYL
jgi:hypothetical protein